MSSTSQPIALITGGGRGLGLALARGLLSNGWRVVTDARRTGHLAAALPGAVVVPGDVTDPAHREALAEMVGELSSAAGAPGRLDLLVNNASDLGPSPLPRLDDVPLAAARKVFETNVLAPLALTQQFLPVLRAAGGIVVNVSSDAAVEAYEGWGAYGAAKAALDQLSAVLAAEEPELAVYAVDPGDMRTEMHQAAFPGEDISDRQEPEAVVPALLRLIATRPPSGRLRAADFAEARA
ncbi:SDR family oxidoreductase [Trebonia kvetii]|uniref:SDR family oxidoreductase n=1 Tax=Trebonia kvetii TaxID=2480626 RepID=A0A6P2BU62_9ACTN|nr:SDR family oxidoreductase [Trebonia kvetii]TVZ00753.1 SDR family oxidoreductase [Trebonia kvetii]